MTKQVTSPEGPRVRGVRGGREVAAGEAIGEWLVVAPLARGGFGTVYEVRHARTRAPAALKLLHADLTTSPEMLARFEREIQVVRRLRHPNVVELVDAGFSADHRPYFCMELLAGEELGARVGRRFDAAAIGLPPDQALAILEPLCDALATAHALGIVHRDVKASNVIICAPAAPGGPERVVLLDFGIAKLGDALAPELTATHQALGTPASMAPEQIYGRRIDARTDVYALGALLFFMLTGRTPFHDPSPTMTQYLHLHARRPRASALAKVPPRLDDVIARAMAIEPADRFADPLAMLAAARAALRDAQAGPIVEGNAFAILVSVSDATGASDTTSAGSTASLDAALLDELERILPEAERFLARAGFALALDLGSSALFVAPPRAAVDPVAVAIAAYDHVAPRDPRVKVGVAAHQDAATFAGEELTASPLLRASHWQLPEPLEGVWVTHALDPAAANGRRLR